jgi:hypothetical protein
MEYVTTITLEHTGDAEDADALLDTFLAQHADASPIVGEDLKAGTIDVTFAVNAEDGYEAFELARGVFARATEHTRFARPVVGVTVEAAGFRELEAA